MAVKVGSFTIPGTGAFGVTGAGFRPAWGIFLFSNMSTEDVWTPGPSAGVGIACVRNSVGGVLTIDQANVAEIWENEGVGSSYLSGLVTWVREHRALSDGWAAYVSSFDADGFTINFASGFTTGATGKHVFYLVGDDEFSIAGEPTSFPGDSATRTLGWLPMAFFTVGAGGSGSPPAYNVGLTDRSRTAVMGGNFGDELGGGRHIIDMYRGLVDPNVDVQSWWGIQDNGVPALILEPQETTGVIWGSEFDPTRTDTEWHPDWIYGSGFSSGVVREQSIIFGDVACVTGSFMPNSSVGSPSIVELPFTPETVVLFSAQNDRAGVGNAEVFGATALGFCDTDDQAVIAYGGFWNPPFTFQSNGFISRAWSWIGNCIDGSTAGFGNVGNLVSAGSARVVPEGFEHTTEQHNASVMYPVHYWAIGPLEEAPGFFRVVGR